jgi:predicted phosphodiesterase
VVVFGHSHVPLLEDEGGLLMVNPGSPTDRRRMPTYTMGVLELGAGRARAQLVDLGLERAPAGIRGPRWTAG